MSTPTPPLVLFLGSNLEAFRGAVHCLSTAGYRTALADLPGVFWRHVVNDEPHAIIIDGSSTGKMRDPLGLCHELLESGSGLIILLVRGGTRRLRTRALACGANLVLIAPGYEEELLAFLNAQRARSHTATSSTALGAPSAIVVDWDERCVYRDNRTIYFSPREYSLLRYLARQNGRIVPSHELSANVWDAGDCAASRARVKNYIARLRHKLEPDPQAPRFLKTVRSRGYKLTLQDPLSALPLSPAAPAGAE